MNSPAKWKWNCRNCGRANATVPADDGKATCEHCSSLQSLRPGPPREAKAKRLQPANRPDFAEARHLPRSQSSDSATD